MQEALGIVIFAVVALAAVAAVASLVGRDRLYEQIGRGGFSLDETGPPPAAPGSAAGMRERDEEVRQMLKARDARRAARGEAGRDVEAELAELVRPSVDEGLRAEIRTLVVARNARRVARGHEALDVDAEVERRISEL
jgi:hypothetical protein